MTVAEVINRYRRRNEDEIPMEELLEWVETIERLIYEEIIMLHEDAIKYIPEDKLDYFEDFGLENEVIADMPYIDVYLHYIDMKWYELNKEVDKYNAAATMFNSAYTTFASYYNRHHKHLQTQPKWLHHQLIRR